MIFTALQGGESERTHPLLLWQAGLAIVATLLSGTVAGLGAFAASSANHARDAAELQRLRQSVTAIDLTLDRHSALLIELQTDLRWIRNQHRNQAFSIQQHEQPHPTPYASSLAPFRQPQARKPLGQNRVATSFRP